MGVKEEVVLAIVIVVVVGGEEEVTPIKFAASGAWRA